MYKRSETARAGFTLIELLVALVISGILTGVIFQLLQGQSRFSAVQNARQEVQQNARGALDLIASELRSVGPRGLIAAEPDSVRFRSARTWGVVCTQLPVANPSDPVWIRFPAGTFPNDFKWGEPHWGFVFADGNVPDWRAATQASDPGLLPSSSPCDALLGTQAIAGNSVEDLAFSASGFSYSCDPATLTAAEYEECMAPAGSRVYVYEEVKYSIAESALSGETRWWIKRMVGYAGAGPNMQPFAGPVPNDTDGLQFNYYNGSSWTSDPTDPNAVTRISVSVWTESSGRNASLRQDERVSTIVDLRNRS